ncbi:MAG: DNA polymerase I, partial [Chloroflexi bacterium]|nr:DNA polymerase I [Chloroflexota bacterium]
LADLLSDDLRERNQKRLFYDLEIPLVPVLIRMQVHGMVVDAAYLRTMSQDFSLRLGQLREQIHSLAGHPFNLNSPQQLAGVLFDELKLPVIRRTKTGYSTDASVMEALQDKHPIVALILEHRQLEKIKSTYLDALPEMINPHTGRVHTSFKQAGTSTGRLSSADPNLQNIPVRSDVGKQVRAAFVAPPGHVLLSCDYSQVELRILAHVSQDPELMGAFQRNEDVHASTAAAILGVPLEEVTSAQRGLAKAINFGLMYGMGDYGLSARTDLSVEQARAFIDAYFSRFRQVKAYLDETVRRAHEVGYVETVLGRRRYFPELKTRSAQAVMRAAERAAVNMPIQGSAADILKLAMIALDRHLTERGLAAAMVLQVHDELVLEVPAAELDVVRPLVIDTMQNAYPLSVPLKVDAAVGTNWMEMN